MRHGFACKNFIVIFLVVLTMVDAVHPFYISLPELYSSHTDLQTSINEENLLANEYLPISTLEDSFYDEQQEERDNDDWEPLFERTPKYHITVNERSHENQKQLDYLLALSRQTDPLDKKSLYDNDDTAIDQLSHSNTDDQDWPVDNSAALMAHLQSDEQIINSERSKRRNDALFLTIVGVCSLVGVLGLVAAAIFWYKIQKRAEDALDAEYPSYGVTGPGGNGTKISPSTTMSDRKLAQSAQMFHYQQQRQQMIAQEKVHLDNKPVQSDDSDDEIPNGGDYTVYECPGLAPTGEMEVRNPLFAEPDSSNADAHPTTNNHYPQPTTVTPSSSPPKDKSLS